MLPKTINNFKTHLNNILAFVHTLYSPNGVSYFIDYLWKNCCKIYATGIGYLESCFCFLFNTSLWCFLCMYNACYIKQFCILLSFTHWSVDDVLNNNHSTLISYEVSAKLWAYLNIFKHIQLKVESYIKNCISNLKIEV